MKNAFQLFSEQKNKLFTIIQLYTWCQVKKNWNQDFFKKKKRDVVGY